MLLVLDAKCPTCGPIRYLQPEPGVRAEVPCLMTVRRMRTADHGCPLCGESILFALERGFEEVDAQ